MTKQFMFMIFALLLTTSTFAEDFVAVNSYDGRDVLSAVFYANVKDLPVKFMPSTGGSAELLAHKVGNNHNVLLIQSTELPVSGFVENSLENRNNTLEIYSSTDGGVTNLELAVRSGAKNFIVVDSAYSDSALSVLAYAAASDAYVLLANSDNIHDIDEIVASADSIIIYGLVEAEVRDTLAKYNPETIGKGEDRYEDNVLMLERMMEDYPYNTVLVDSGNSLEESMAEAEWPVLFSGRLPPTVTYNFIKQSAREGKLSTLMLLGNELVVPMYDLRTKIKTELEAETGEEPKLGVIVKFGQATSVGGDILDLDRFNLPAYVPSLTINEIVYNAESKTIMVTVENTGDGSAYYTNEIRVTVDGADYLALYDEDVMIIDRGEKAGTEYYADLSEIESGEIAASVITKFGYSKNALDSWDSLSGPLLEINYVDNSDLYVQGASYNSGDGRLFITVRNNGDEVAYFRNEVELLLGGQVTTVKGTSQSIDGTSLVVDEIPLVLSDEDLAANEEITVNMDYGAREGFLGKEATYTLPLESEGFPLWLIAILMLLLLVLLAGIIFIVSRKKKEEKK